MTHDGRVSAWLGAYKRIEAVAKAKRQNPDIPDSKFQQALYEAQILTGLACAPEDIGTAAGTFLAEECAQEQRLADKRAELINQVLS